MDSINLAFGAAAACLWALAAEVVSLRVQNRRLRLRLRLLTQVIDCADNPNCTQNDAQDTKYPRNGVTALRHHFLRLSKRDSSKNTTPNPKNSILHAVNRTAIPSAPQEVEHDAVPSQSEAASDGIALHGGEDHTQRKEG